MKLEGLSALVTGATQGLGYEIAKTFIEQGASVYICSRTKTDVESAVVALNELKALPDQKVFGSVCDIGDLSSVDSFAEVVLKALPNLDILVNNAGIYGPFGTIEDVDWQNWMQAIQINLMGPIYLTRCLVPHFKSKKSGKIINLSGGGATSPMPGISSYAVSKSGFVRFSETLAHELVEFNIDVNSIAPGALTTRLMDEVIEDGEKVLNSAFISKMKKIQSSGGTPLSVGANCAVYLASQESNKITGRLISAAWDEWETLHNYKDELGPSDIYTLRRIIAKDRNKTWGDKD